MLQIDAECYRVLKGVTECYRVLQSVTEYCRVLQSTTEYYKVLQGISSASTWTNFWAGFTWDGLPLFLFSMTRFLIYPLAGLYQLLEEST